MNSSFSDKVIRKINSYSSSELDASTLFSDSEKRRNIYLELNDDYKIINNTWDEITRTSIISNRAKYGPFIVKIKRIIHRLISWYIDQIVIAQTKFNGSTVRILNKSAEYMDELNTSQTKINNKLEELYETVNTKYSKLDDLNRILDEKIIMLNNRINTIDDNFEMLGIYTEDKPYKGIDSYLDFENYFRGSEELIISRLKVYEEFLLPNSSALDIGCGRGELLELLGENHVNAVGIDINAEMIKYCKRKGLNAHNADAYEYLLGTKDDDFDYIFLIQVAEHLDYKYLKSLIELSYKKLKKDGILFMETPNHQSLYIYTNSFYIDPTHTKPVSPHFIRYICLNANFKSVDFKYISPIESESKLELTESLDKVVADNFNKINNIVFGDQDCIVIAKK
ncbi:class I SAM-dependent methyltransferase [Acetoanaerobium noterae]|uniref:class I SAM-dependent methyltransferase n=1 Tax=Acetoanaerobium noterae TaxID=745369 RepID=UPI0028A76C70|nr:class I SAM-dependent methyltransferase [Acetoanaerobium noterae]